MTMFQKPKVGIAFNPAQQVVEEDEIQAPLREPWGNTPARRRAMAVLLVVLCVFAFAYPALSGLFLPADDATVTTNPVMYSVTGLPTCWLAPQRLPQFSPMAYTILWVEHLFFTTHPRGYHVVSLLVHAANALLLWHLLRRLELPAAWLAAAVFALDPVQVDTVSWISQQRYLFCGFFYLCALLVYLRRTGLNPEPPPYAPGTEPLIELSLPTNPATLLALSITLFVLALLCHILAATFPLVVLIMIWWERGKITQEDVKPLIPFAAIAAAFSVLAAVLFRRRAGEFWYADINAVNWLWIWGRAACTYLFITLVPANLAFAYPRWDASGNPWWAWLMTAGIIAAVVGLWQMRRRWGRGPITAALLFLCLLLPAALGASDAYDSDMPGVFIREHVLYLACAAVLVPLTIFLHDLLLESKFTTKFAVLPPVMPLLSLVIVGGLAAATFVHSHAYNDPTSLWQNVLQKDPTSSVALNTLGSMELDADDRKSAEQHFMAAYTANHDDVDALLNLARLEETPDQSQKTPGKPDYAAAIDRYYEILAHHPDRPEAHMGIAADLSAEGHSEDALREYEVARKLDPYNPEIYNDEGLIYSRLGDLNAAVDQYNKAISIDPKQEFAYLNLANARFQQGSNVEDIAAKKQFFTEARDALQKLLDLNPRSSIAWLNLGVMAMATRDLKDAEMYFRASIYSKYDNAEAFFYLGRVLVTEGDKPGKTDRLGEAIYDFKHAYELDPSNETAHQMQIQAQQRKDAIIQQQQQ
jgi:tetratricopeptide (TPR) repeat protein